VSLTPARAPEEPPPSTGLTAKIATVSAFLVTAGALVDASIAIFTKVQPVTCRLPISPPWCSGSAQVAISIDRDHIGNAIAVKANQKREACIVDLANEIEYQTQYKQNILVVNLAQHPDDTQLNNIAIYKPRQCEDALVGVWAFRDGEFTHEGDGGYINWYLIGNFKIDDQHRHVVFSAR
jgi:hypothetical protein